VRCCVGNKHLHVVVWCHIYAQNVTCCSFRNQPACLPYVFPSFLQVSAAAVPQVLAPGAEPAQIVTSRAQPQISAQATLAQSKSTQFGMQPSKTDRRLLVVKALLLPHLQHLGSRCLLKYCCRAVSRYSWADASGPAACVSMFGAVC
jgi:hypothetical protein